MAFNGQLFEGVDILKHGQITTSRRVFQLYNRLYQREIATSLQASRWGCRLLRHYLAGMHPQLTVGANVLKMITAIPDKENK